MINSLDQDKQIERAVSRLIRNRYLISSNRGVDVQGAIYEAIALQLAVGLRSCTLPGETRRYERKQRTTESVRIIIMTMQ